MSGWLDVAVMLVTAGFGTRLAPLTDLLPKPAVPVANRPLAWFALDHLQRSGVQRVVLNTHHLAAELERELTRVAPPGLALRFVHEPAILGTGGGIHNAFRGEQAETYLVMNGKYVFAPDLHSALAQHRATRAFATMLLADLPGTPGHGAVKIDAAGRVRSLRNVPADPDDQLRPMFYTGVSLLSARAVAELPAPGELIDDGYRRWMARGEAVLAYVEPSACRDAGISLWHYWDVNQALLDGRVQWPGISPDGAGVLCDPSSQIGAGARLTRSAIGAGATIAPGVQVDGSIVWPGAHVQTDVRGAIVLPDARVIHPPRP